MIAFRIPPLFVLLASWMILAPVNADLHREVEEEDLSNNQFLAKTDQEDRVLQNPCPLGELWEAVSNMCVPNSCDSAQACPEHGETCRNIRRFCLDETKVCGQYTCDSACPEFERLDPVTNACVPVSCSSFNACANAGPGKQCLRKVNNNCEPGKPCPQFLCCDDISECDSLYCAYGNQVGPDGCPICDCKPCYGGWPISMRNSRSDGGSRRGGKFNGTTI